MSAPPPPGPESGPRLGSELRALPARRDVGALLADLRLRFPGPWLEYELARLGSLAPLTREGDQARRLLAPAPPLLGDSAEEIAEALESTDWVVALAALDGLVRLPRQAARALLLGAVRGPCRDPWVRSRMASCLGELGGPEAAEELTLLLQDGTPRVVANALEALLALEPETGMHAAYHLLEAGSNRVRATSVAAVAAVNPGFAVALVQDMATSADPWMQASACYLATSLPDEEGEELLLEVLTQSRSPALLSRAVERLPACGGAASLEALAHLRADPDEVLAGAARKARGELVARIGEPATGRTGTSFEVRRRQALAQLDEPGEASDAGVSVLADLVATISPDAGTQPEPEALVEVEDSSIQFAPPTSSPPLGGGATLLGVDGHWLRAHRPERDTLAQGTSSGRTDPGEAALDPALEAATQQALAWLEQGLASQAVEILQAALPTDGRGAPPLVAWALAVSFLQLGEVGLALPHVRTLDPLRLALDQHYELAVRLDGAGAVSSAIAGFEALRARRLHYRDVHQRLEGLRLREGRVPEQVWQQLARRYRDLSPLGVGGMGRVFRATERDSGRVVAVKVPGEEALRSEELRERLLREMDALSRIDHPNVVRVYEVSRGEVPYYSMELVEGVSLGDLIERGPLPPVQALSLLAPIAEALAHLHQQGMIHRDVKPHNILLPGEGSAKLTDFGIAFVDSRTSMTQTGRMMGTLGYMSPEQVEGRDPTPAVDVYSFGVVLYEALTGTLPFPAQTAVLKVYRDAPRVEEAAPGTPAAVGELVADCLARAPEARLPDGRAMSAALRRVATGQ